MRVERFRGWALVAAIGVAAFAAPVVAYEPAKKSANKEGATRPAEPTTVDQRENRTKTETPSAQDRLMLLKQAKASKTPVAAVPTQGSVAGGPVNDDCANAIPLLDGETEFSTVGAATDGDPAAACNFFGNMQIGQDIWFHYTATCDGQVTVSACGSMYDTKIAAYEGTSCPTPAPLACNDDFCAVQSRVLFEGMAGTSYTIRVGGFGAASGIGMLTVACVPSGDNETCAGAAPIFDGATPFSTTGSTTDGPGDALCVDIAGNNQVNQDIWFNYTATCSGNLTVGLCGSLYDTKLALYEGTGCVGPILDCNDDFCALQSSVSASVDEGSSYKIRVGGYQMATGSGTITITCGTGGSGGAELCADSTEVFEGATAFSTIGATTDGPPNALCTDVGGSSQVNQDIWFHYTATCDGTLIVNTCGSGYDSKIAVYETNDCVGPIVGCNDDSCGLQSTVAGDAVLGQTYKIRVGGYQTATGTGTLNVACAVSAGNDNCEDATDVTDGTYSFNTLGASTDGEPNGLCDFFGDDDVANDIWFNYTATCSQTLMVALCGSGFDTKLAVYDGNSCVGDILACNDDSCGLQSRIMTGVTEGNLYKIRVGGFAGATGVGTMAISCGAGPCDAGIGDCCEAHGGVGCEDPACCTEVCSCDPFCCETEWDVFCAGTGFAGGCGAQILCEDQPCYIPPPENDLCFDAIPIQDGNTDYTNIGTTTDGPPLPAECDEGFGTEMGSDVWFTYTATCTGTVTFSTCNQSDYDSRLAIYEGCGCPATNDTLVGCNDDGPGCAGFSSQMEAFLNEGTCYLLRVGGFGPAGAQGAATMSISCDPVHPACLAGSGDCLMAHPNAGCEDLLCCDRVCGVDEFCCEFEWDETCVNQANNLCVAPPNDECQDAPIEQLPHTYMGSNFNADPDCGLFSPPPDQVWIAFELANDSSVTLDYCGTEPSFGNAWLNLALGCPCDGFTEAGAFDTTTCGDGNVTIEWMCLPAGTYYYPVLTEPGSEGLYTINVTAGECIDPCAGATGDCFSPHGTPGCEDSACCNTVCDIDAFCCTTEWDDICVDEANDLCGGGVAPPNDACANSVDVSEGTFAYTNQFASTDGPGLPTSCDEGFGLSFMSDVWYDYTPSTSGDVTISLCDGTPYDARIALYQGCGCPVSNANLVACNDDGCGDPGSPSTLTAPVVSGNCYKLRVGGFGAAQGMGMVDISLSGIDCPAGVVSFMTPPPGVVDARQTGNPVGMQNQGINQVVVSGPVGAPAGCWAVCETVVPGGSMPISIANVSGAGPMYTINLSRAISPGGVTTVQYLGNNAFASYTFHPANANGDSTANPIDILRHIDYLNGVATPPWGIYSTDIDRSGAANPQDILRLIDLLNGAGDLVVWNNTPLPSNAGVCP